MIKTLITEHTSSIIKGLSGRIDATSRLKHNLTKGEIRELLVSEVLSVFLTSQFEIGTGIIINNKGVQSNQMDLIIYDTRILPPFIKQRNIGAYPAECVIATIEIKSRLGKRELLDAENAASNLYSIYEKTDKIKPLCTVFGATGTGVKDLKNGNGNSVAWLNQNIKTIKGICLLNKYSWFKFPNKWEPCYNITNNDETKRFFAVLVDNIRSISENRYRSLMKNHQDWLSKYIRE